MEEKEEEAIWYINVGLILTNIYFMITLKLILIDNLVRKQKEKQK